MCFSSKVFVDITIMNQVPHQSKAYHIMSYHTSKNLRWKLKLVVSKQCHLFYGFIISFHAAFCFLSCSEIQKLPLSMNDYNEALQKSQVPNTMTMPFKLYIPQTCHNMSTHPWTIVYIFLIFFKACIKIQKGVKRLG